MANEQTSVPLYAASEVLTAANMNISAGTGVPVFATTVTRDAAFGGAGEKVLAEGQLCYLSASNIVQYYDGAAWATVGPTGTKLGQVVSTLLDTTFSTASTSYVDITGLSVSITPTLNTSKVLVLAQINYGYSGDIVDTLRLVRGSTSIDIGAVSGVSALGTIGGGNGGGANAVTALIPGVVSFLDSPATTSATTYKMQMFVNSGTGYINRTGRDNTSFDMRAASTITVIEVLA
jgi:hypothetical protein